MKKVFIFIVILVIGSTLVYFGLDKFLKKDEPATPVKLNKNSDSGEKEKSVPTKEAFVKEAERLQEIAENKDDNETCKCYNIKELDPSTKLVGSILVHTTDDLFVSTMWISNGYYLLDGVEGASIGTLDDSSDTASIYCGEESPDSVSSLCF